MFKIRAKDRISKNYEDAKSLPYSGAARVTGTPKRSWLSCVEGLHAPWLLDSPMNGQTFLVYGKPVLVHELQPGDLVVCDNLQSHHASGVRAALEAI